MPAAKIREEFRALAKDAGNLYERLSGLLNNRDAYTALTRSDIPPSISSAEAQRLMQDERRLLSEINDALLGAPKRFSMAAHRVKREKRGPKAGNVYWLVGNLDGIREQFTGKKITRSYKGEVEYIKCVCKIADPDIGPGTIDRAIRHRSRHRTEG